MTIDPERLGKIRANADFVVRQLGSMSGIDFGLNQASVAWTEGFLERQRGTLAGGDGDGIVNVLGSFLGEAIIAAVPGAQWTDDEAGNLGILFASGDMAFPFAKVRKQLDDGLDAGESMLSFYNIAVDYVAAGKLSQQEGGGTS
jgi:hypothetical protein